jgi:hypothetical protein
MSLQPAARILANRGAQISGCAAGDRLGAAGLSFLKVADRGRGRVNVIGPLCDAARSAFVNPTPHSSDTGW